MFFALLETAVKDPLPLRIFILFMTSSSLFATEIVAHRGASREMPENTLVAASRAWQDGADAVELDVHLTSDGRLVVIHDADTKRTTRVPGLVRERSLAELQALDAGSWKGKLFADERIPTLDEFLAVGPVNRRFFIEVKCGVEAIPELKACLDRAHLSPDQAVIISFPKDVVALSKKEMPQYKALWLLRYEKDKQTGRRPALEEIIAEAHRLKLDGFDLSADWPIDADFVSKLRAAGLGLWVWTVDNAKTARRLKDAGVDGITTNRPGWLRTQLL